MCAADDSPAVCVVTVDGVTEDMSGDLPIGDVSITALAPADAPNIEVQPECAPVEGVSTADVATDAPTGVVPTDRSKL